MAQQTFLNKVREWIGGLAWSIFLWSARMTEDEYFAELDKQRSPTLREAAGEICPVCAGQSMISIGGDKWQECYRCHGTGQI